MSREQFLLFLLLILVHKSNPKRNFVIKMTSYSCDVFRPKSFNFFDCALYNRGKHPAMLTKFNLAEQIDDFEIHFALDAWRKDNRKLNLVDLKLDGCKYFGSVPFTNFMLVAQTRIMKISNLPKKCPIKANHTYAINNYTAYPDDFPAAVPQADWRITVQFFHSKQIYANMVMRGAVVYHS